MSMDQLGHAYIVAADRAHRMRLPVYIYWATDIYSRGGYILVSDAFLPQLSEIYEEFEYIDTVYPDVRIERK